MASSLVEVSVFKFWKRRRKSITARMHERQKDRSRFSIFRRKKKEMEMFGYMVCTTTIVGTGTMASTGGKYILQFPSEINEYIMQMRLIYSFVHTHTHICVLRFLTRYSGRGKKKNSLCTWLLRAGYQQRMILPCHISENLNYYLGSIMLLIGDRRKGEAANVGCWISTTE